MSIIASSNIENFEIKKLHQLFQAHYLISVGDYKSALRSYSELNDLFESNRHLWATPPIYYLLTLDGVLGSLRGIRNYDGMHYFINKLKSLESPSVNFNANVAGLVFLYELFPSLDSGDFKAAYQHMVRNCDLYKKMSLLSLTRQAELSLYSALVMFGNREFKSALKFLNMIIVKSKSYYYLPHYRTIRLINLMIKFELKDDDYLHHEIRSIKREISESGKVFKIEKFMLKFFLGRGKYPITYMRDEMWAKMSIELEELRQDIFEQQVLKIFDFTSWVESKIRRINLSEVFRLNHAPPDHR